MLGKQVKHVRVTGEGCMSVCTVQVSIYSVLIKIHVGAKHRGHKGPNKLLVSGPGIGREGHQSI